MPKKEMRHAQKPYDRPTMLRGSRCIKKIKTLRSMSIRKVCRSGMQATGKFMQSIGQIHAVFWAKFMMLLGEPPSTNSNNINMATHTHTCTFNCTGLYNVGLPVADATRKAAHIRECSNLGKHLKGAKVLIFISAQRIIAAMLVHETYAVAMPLHCSKTGQPGERHADLSQPDEEVKDVGVVVDNGTGLYVGGKLGLALGVEGLVEIILTLIKLVLAQCDGPT